MTVSCGLKNQAVLLHMQKSILFEDLGMSREGYSVPMKRVVLKLKGFGEG